jgi:Spy/CpxP family protein refolding chaperone
MLLAMLAWSMPTQAGGVSACATGVEAACSSHAPGDADEAPADEHDTQPHHHGGCHGHHIGVADHDRATGAQVGQLRTTFAHSSVFRVSSGTDPGLRPPQA